MKLTNAETKITRTKTGTITVADLRKKFRIPPEARISLGTLTHGSLDALTDDTIIATITHVVEAQK